MTMPQQMTRADLNASRRLLRSIAMEIEAGTRHFSDRGRELTTAVEIVQAMLDDGHVSVELPPGRPHPDYLRPV